MRMTLKEVREAKRAAHRLTDDWEWCYHPEADWDECVTQNCRVCGGCHEMFFADDLDDMPQEGWEYVESDVAGD